MLFNVTKNAEGYDNIGFRKLSQMALQHRILKLAESCGKRWDSFLFYGQPHSHLIFPTVSPCVIGYGGKGQRCKLGALGGIERI